MIMSDSSVSGEEFDSEFDQTGYFSLADDSLLYLFIETLTGTSFEMRVSPDESVVAIKAKLQQLEGIPVNQQHLLYNNTQLNNNQTLKECDIPDGATLKLVLAMRGGPINTRKVLLPDNTAKEVQDAMDKDKEDILSQIPEGGHVTVLLFRDGNDINLYHVLEKPDGSYSPLSDSWSGSSIRNLFAEPDDPDVQQRIQENSKTMTKMQELKNRMDSLYISKKKRNNAQMINLDSSIYQIEPVNLPPIGQPNETWLGNQLADNGFEKETTTITELSRHHLGQTRFLQQQQRTKEHHHQSILPYVESRNTRAGDNNIAYRSSSPLPRQNKKSKFVFGNPIPQRQSSILNSSTQPRKGSLTSSRPSSKMISLDISELTRNNNVETKEGYSLEGIGHHASRRQRRKSRIRNNYNANELSNDIFSNPDPLKTRKASNPHVNAQTLLEGKQDQYKHDHQHDQQQQQQQPKRLHRSLAEAELRMVHRESSSAASKNSRSVPDIKKTLEDQINANIDGEISRTAAAAPLLYAGKNFTQNESVRDSSLVSSPQLPTYTSSTMANNATSVAGGGGGGVAPFPRGLERRLLNSRRGKLSRPVAGSNVAGGGGGKGPPPRLLASPKSTTHKSPRSGDLRLRRPSYQTRPLSGPKKIKSTSKPKCRAADCRKKLNITNSFSCRCGNMFCPKHRHPEFHGCPFDYKTEGRKILEANNPIISIPKLPKI